MSMSYLDQCLIDKGLTVVGSDERRKETFLFNSKKNN